mmetsp:Transcript_40490/g.49103  ORF Transcript_40490/g.49103 Transcript_40490/m.49103 type:complete len:321 (-) Transcript_40490:563-1525(-)|eukprot:CAMPEP_0197847324 /NCGR_PEP_ID=MMETSP1438-20131217/5712_1 /TAXON_ID=1461541 /ORGANISM="Pterosperma sp., Strain CCMP1384" /LENGTH=320 /DNA_ID=CAMNT_0043459207 /DNA_START=113 /DNA_END=1075 /DNA_ORIENTATION=-
MANTGKSSAPMPSEGTLHTGALLASYAGLIGVNVVFGAGLFGVPTNKTISDAYPSNITPAGFTFAIWGPIFLLEGGGAALMAIAPTRSPVRSEAMKRWMQCWAAEVAWQFVFAQAPIPAESASQSSKLIVLVPSALLLIAAQASMLRAALKLRFSPSGGGDEPKNRVLQYLHKGAGALLVDLPTGLNAGWLGAAAGIGVSLVAKEVPFMQCLAHPCGAAMLVSAVSGGGALASAVLGSKPGSLLVGVGYAGATAWACFGITRSESVPPEVKAAAARGIWVAACGVAGALVGAVVHSLTQGKRTKEGAKHSDVAQMKPLLE